jgi:hypothetical protein
MARSGRGSAAIFASSAFSQSAPAAGDAGRASILVFSRRALMAACGRPLNAAGVLLKTGLLFGAFRVPFLVVSSLPVAAREELLTPRLPSPFNHRGIFTGS